MKYDEQGYQIYSIEMVENKEIKAPVLIAGDCKPANTVAICLLLARQPVVIFTQDILRTHECLDIHAEDIRNAWGIVVDKAYVTVTDKLDKEKNYSLAIAVTNESLSEKKELIELLENVLSSDKVIAVNSESIGLSELQKFCRHPERIIGANWVEPAHTTYFLEIISNNNNDKKLVEDFFYLAKQHWKKDPYLINGDRGIRARLMCALIREAFYLVENGYVSFEDIDRACRNDAGYYLPFAGNFRYMDLMGAYIYGIVMKDMNPDLTRQNHVPAFFKDMMQNGWLGMKNNRGFYNYTNGEVESWNELSGKFSYQTKAIVDKYNSVM